MLRQLQAALASNTLQTQTSKDQSCSTFSDHDDIRQMLPLKSMEELEAFEIRLQDERFRLIAFSYLSRLSISCFRNSTLNVMRALMSNDLATHFTFSGKSSSSMPGKRLFIHLMLFPLASDSARANNSGTNEEVYKVIRNWLKNAGFRKKAEETGVPSP